MSRIMHYHGDDTADFYICRNPYLDGERQSPYYLEFDVGTGTFNTARVQRFETVDQAQYFCDLLIKKGDLSEIMDSVLTAEAEYRNALKAAGRAEFAQFMDKITRLGVAPDKVPDLILAYNGLGDYARGMLTNQESVRRYAAGHSQPEAAKPEPRMTLGEFMDIYQRDIDVCLVDRDTGEHVLPAICYYAPEEQVSSSYTEAETWLRSLPLEMARNEDGVQLAIVKTDLSRDQVNFLLIRDGDGFDNPEMDLLTTRADLSNASFAQRLAYLQNGTSFETAFDGECMDVTDARLRMELCEFLSDHGTVNIMNPGAPDGQMAAYAVLPRNRGGNLSGIEFCHIPLTRTEPGKGLTATIDGKCYYAEHKARQAREAVMSKDTVPNRDAGKEL